MSIRKERIAVAPKIERNIKKYLDERKKIMKESSENYGLVTLICCTLIVATAILCCAPTVIKERKATSIEQYCVVQNKYRTTGLGRGACTTNCYLDVYIKSTDEIHKGVRVSRSIYNGIEIGNEVKGLVYYYGDEFLKIEIIEPNYITEPSVSTVVQNTTSAISYFCT